MKKSLIIIVFVCFNLGLIGCKSDEENKTPDPEVQYFDKNGNQFDADLTSNRLQACPDSQLAEFKSISEEIDSISLVAANPDKIKYGNVVPDVIYLFDYNRDTEDRVRKLKSAIELYILKYKESPSCRFDDDTNLKGAQIFMKKITVIEKGNRSVVKEHIYRSLIQTQSSLQNLTNIDPKFSNIYGQCMKEHLEDLDNLKNMITTAAVRVEPRENGMDSTLRFFVLKFNNDQEKLEFTGTLVNYILKYSNVDFCTLDKMSPELFDKYIISQNQSKELDIFVDFRDYTYQFFKLVMLSDDKFLREGPEPFRQIAIDLVKLRDHLLDSSMGNKLEYYLFKDK